MALGAAQFTELLAATRDKIGTTGAVDNVLKPHPTLDILKPKARNYTGESLRLTLEAAEDTSSAWTDASGSFSTSASTDVLGAATFAYSKPLVSKVRLVFEDLERNTGPEQIVALVKAHMGACEKGHAKAIATALHAVKGSFAAGQIESLDTLVSDIAPLGGINPADAPYWKATRLYLPASGAGAVSIQEAFRKVANSIWDNGGERVDIIVAGADVYDEYENALDPAVRYTNVGGTAETRFAELKFDGITVRRDPDCPRDRAYFLNSGSLEFGFLNNNFMKVREAQAIVGTLDSVTPIASILVLGTANRRANGLLVRGEEPTGRTA